MFPPAACSPGAFAGLNPSFKCVLAWTLAKHFAVMIVRFATDDDLRLRLSSSWILKQTISLILHECRRDYDAI